jgi:hypothetical protein
MNDRPKLPNVDDIGRRIEDVASAVEAAVDGPTKAQVSANNSCEREATAESAVAVVKRQLGLEHPTLKSAWTTREIARLLHELHYDPMGEIKLGSQHLGAGFVEQVWPAAKTSPRRPDDPDALAKARVAEAEDKEAVRTRMIAAALAPEQPPQMAAE